MRNFNRPVATVLTSMAAFLGGNALAPSTAAADQAPISSPKVFKECARIATKQEIVIKPDQTATADTGFDWKVAVPKGTVGRADFTLTTERGGPIVTPSGVSCPGVVTDKTTMYLKSGASTTTIPDGIPQSTFGNADLNAPAPSPLISEGSFSYRRLCQIAKRHSKNTVRLDFLETMTYTEPGYPTFQGKSDYSQEFINSFTPDPALGLPCKQNKSGYQFDINDPPTMGVLQADITTPPTL
jgi:hypothetical protein